MMKRLPIALVAVLLTVGLVAAEVVPASPGPTASVAKKKKKKCTKKKRKKHKCGKDDVAATLRALISGSSFSSTSPINVSGSSGTNTDLYRFCQNGSYERHYENDGTNSGGSFHTSTTQGGSWQLTDAERSGTYALKGMLVLTIDSWQDSEGYGPPPSPDYETFVAPFGKPFFTIGDHPVWTRTPGGAGC